MKKNSLYLGSYFGIPVSVHWSFLLLIFYFVWISFKQGQTSMQLFTQILFVLSVFLCVLLHEFGHALAAKKYGIKTHSIVLLPIGGLASLEKLPSDPKQELWVAFAGPLVNIVIALLLLPFVSLDLEQMSNSISGIQPFLTNLFFTNIILSVFNLLPAFPMDGGRVLRALLSFKLPAHKATQIAAWVGKSFALIFVFLGLFVPNVSPFLALIGVFIFMGAGAESNAKQKEFELEGLLVKDILMTKYEILYSQDPIQKAIDLLLASSAKEFVVLNQNNEYEGVLTRDNLLKILAQKNTEALVQEAITKIQPIGLNDKVAEVYAAKAVSESTFWPVMHNNEIVGVLDLENILEYVLVKNAQLNS
jgi:Zn-dependent protease/predicted transcriptional regulator